MAERGLRKTILRLRTREGQTSDETEVVTIDLEIARLEGQVAGLMADRAVYIAGRASFPSPTEAEFKEITDAVTTVDRMVADALVTKEIIALGAAILSSYTDIKTVEQDASGG